MWTIAAMILIVFTAIGRGHPITTSTTVDGRSSGSGFEPELPSQCKAIEGKNELDTLIQRRQCSRIFENSYIEWSEEMLADKDFADNLEIVYISENNTGRERRSPTTRQCPSFTSEYLRQNTNPKKRSLSPWEYVITLDENRLPKRILDSRCLCTGCIDINTGNENPGNYFSYALPLTIPVRKNGAMTTTEVHIGCTCLIPIPR